MNRIWMFGLSLAAAGVLTALLTIFSVATSTSVNAQGKASLPAEIQAMAPQAPHDAFRKGASPALMQPASTTTEKPSEEPVRIPAIRGDNNYGWVQLQPGTAVDLVRDHGNDVWVRWDGSITKVKRSAIAERMVVLRPSRRASGSSDTISF